MSTQPRTPDGEPETHTDVSLSCRRDGDGVLHRVECVVEYAEVAAGGEDPEVHAHEQAALHYDVTDGTAALAYLAEVTPGRRQSGDVARGVRPDLLRTVSAAEDALERVPGVETVEGAEQTLTRALVAGADGGGEA